MTSHFKLPIFLLLAVNILIGFFIFRDYGLTWDEPYFYSYADALGYAYTPANWFSGHFDLNNSYGVSGDDHKTRGPAYLFLARTIVYGIKSLGSDLPSAWHLVNFLFFQLGVYLLYRLSTRWLTPSAAFATTLLFSTQPLLWGHAFINPKDPPFLTFFLASICFGFEMVDAIIQNQSNKWKKLFLAAFVLGIATSIRVLGPFAGVLVFLYFLVSIASPPPTADDRPRSAVGGSNSQLVVNVKGFFAYTVIAIAVMFLTWPYLWENPIANFTHVLRFMSDNPTNLAVLFHGQIFRASDLPLRYLPFMLVTTLTEPIWFLFLIGVIGAFWKKPELYAFDQPERKKYFASLILILFWFVALLIYVLIKRPAMYDGFRHFLFIVPPIFVFSGFTIEFLFTRLDVISKRIYNSVNKIVLSNWLRVGLIAFLILPGIKGILNLHPYEYTYYNTFIGGTDGAFRNYETDYWLTCYKDAVQHLNTMTTNPTNLYVKREAYIAATYANDNITVHDLRGETNQVQAGDYVLINTRSNEDHSAFKDAPVVIEIQRGDATFCIVRQIP